MKIYVNKIPTEPKDCLFARKELDYRIPDIENGRTIYIYKYLCNVNMKPCNIDCGGKCNKLRTLPKDLV